MAFLLLENISVAYASNVSKEINPYVVMIKSKEDGQDVPGAGLLYNVEKVRVDKNRGYGIYSLSIVTARHNIYTDDNNLREDLTIFLHNDISWQPNYPNKKIKVIAEDIDKDIAVLYIAETKLKRIKADDFCSLPISDASKETIREEVFLIGHQNEIRWAIQKSKLVPSKTDDFSALNFEIPAYYGVSGGVVVSNKAKIIGMPKTIDTMIKIEAITAWLSNRNLIFKLQKENKCIPDTYKARTELYGGLTMRPDFFNDGQCVVSNSKCLFGALLGIRFPITIRQSISVDLEWLSILIDNDIYRHRQISTGVQYSYYWDIDRPLRFGSAIRLEGILNWQERTGNVSVSGEATIIPIEFCELFYRKLGFCLDLAFGANLVKTGNRNTQFTIEERYKTSFIIQPTAKLIYAL